MKLWEKNFEINKEIERFTVGRDREMDLYLAKYDVIGSMAVVLGEIEVHLTVTSDGKPFDFLVYLKILFPEFHRFYSIYLN